MAEATEEERALLWQQNARDRRAAEAERAAALRGDPAALADLKDDWLPVTRDPADSRVLG